ncbi:MAG: hypothetical protein KDC98_11345, partial [Planctomycetes bacterium]|nr:hypothetical protein [Planctomycetota bacterium]
MLRFLKVAHREDAKSSVRLELDSAVSSRGSGRLSRVARTKWWPARPIRHLLFPLDARCRYKTSTPPGAAIDV